MIIVIFVIFIMVVICLIDNELKYNKEKIKFKNDIIYDGVVTDIERYSSIFCKVTIKIGNEYIQVFEYNKDINVRSGTYGQNGKWHPTIEVGDYVQVIEDSGRYRTDARLKKYKLEKKSYIPLIFGIVLVLGMVLVMH